MDSDLLRIPIAEGRAGSAARSRRSSAAAPTGCCRATLYRYYTNREALLEALVRDAIDEAARRLADAGLERAAFADQSVRSHLCLTEADIRSYGGAFVAEQSDSSRKPSLARRAYAGSLLSGAVPELQSHLTGVELMRPPCEQTLSRAPKLRVFRTRANSLISSKTPA